MATWSTLSQFVIEPSGRIRVLDQSAFDAYCARLKNKGDTSYNEFVKKFNGSKEARA